MNLNAFLSIVVAWLAFDSLTDCICIILVFTIFAIIRNTFKQTR